MNQHTPSPDERSKVRPRAAVIARQRDTVDALRRSDRGVEVLRAELDDMEAVRSKFMYHSAFELGWSIPEIAEIMGRDVKWVETHLAEARRRIDPGGLLAAG
jgi:hypothetical protein